MPTYRITGSVELMVPKALEIEAPTAAEAEDIAIEQVRQVGEVNWLKFETFMMIHGPATPVKFTAQELGQ